MRRFRSFGILWLYVNANITVNIEKCIIIFSYQGRNSLINYILVLAKYCIYKTIFISTNKNLNIHAFVALLKKKFIMTDIMLIYLIG